MMYSKFSDALKAFRRNAHVFAGNWKCVVMCQNAHTLDVAFQEAINTMQGTSHAKGMVVKHALRTIETANGADMRFCIANSMDDVDLRLRGLELTHLISVGTMPHNLANYIMPRLRSDIVPPEDYRIDLVESIF